MNCQIAWKIDSGWLHCQISGDAATDVSVVGRWPLDGGWSTAALLEAAIAQDLQQAWSLYFPADRIDCLYDVAAIAESGLPDAAMVLPIIEEFFLRAQCTNLLLQQVACLPNDVRAWNGILFYLPTGVTFYQEYAEALERLSPGNVYTRTFDHEAVLDRRVPVDDPLELLAFCRQHRICTVIHHKTIYPYALMARHVQWNALCERFGLEWIACDLDTYEGAVSIHQGMLRHPTFRRFAIEPHNQRDWQSVTGGWSPHVMPARPCSTAAPFVMLDDDFSLLITSYSRAHLIRRQWPFLCWLLEQCDPAHLYREVTWWYYAVRRLIVEQFVHDARQLEGMIGSLYYCYINCYSLLKMIVLDELSPERPVLLFGDADWNVLYPEYYQQRVLPNSEYESLVQSGRCLTLLVNQQFSCVANSPGFRRCLALGAPFMSYENIVQLPVDAPFSALEYGAAADVNCQDASTLNAIFSARALHSAVTDYVAMHREYVTTWAAYIVAPAAADPAHRAPFVTRYGQRDAQYTQLWDQLLPAYIVERGPFLVQSTEYLWGGQPVPQRPEQSRYSGHRFFGRLQQLWAVDR